MVTMKEIANKAGVSVSTVSLGAQTAASQFGYMLITVSTDGENSESEEIAALKRYGTDGFL